MKNNKNCQKVPENIYEQCLFYSELAPTDPSCNMLQTLLGQKKYEEGMSDEQPLTVQYYLCEESKVMQVY